MRGIGIIGLGIMGRRMAEAMAAHEAFRVISAYDPALATDAGLPMEPDASSVIGNPAVQCVYIATPPRPHLELVRMVAAAGKPIFCEKPLAPTVSEARACVEVVERAQIPAAVNFPFATASAARRLQKFVTAGDLGRLEGATLKLRFARWPRPWQAGAGEWLRGPEEGGFTREVLSHFLFLADRLFGPSKVDQVRVERGSSGLETAVRAVIAYRETQLEIDAAIAGDVDDFNRFEVRGSLASAAVTDWYRFEQGELILERQPPTTSQLDQLASLVDGRPHELASFAEAGAVVELVQKILKS